MQICTTTRTIRSLLATAAATLLLASTAQARQGNTSEPSTGHFTDHAKVLSSQAAALPTVGCDQLPAQDASLSDWLAWDLGTTAPTPDCSIPGATRWLVHWQYQGIHQRQWLAADPGPELPVRVSLR